MMTKILLVLFSEIALGQFNLQWFFNPFSDKNLGTLDITNHAQILDERLEISREDKAIKVNPETFDDDGSVSRSSRGRSLNQRASEPQLPPFRFRPFESLARNINFRSPSNVFCKHF